MVSKNDEHEFITKVVSFVRKPAKLGHSYAFTIPKSYIDAGLIEINKKYEIFLKEVK